MLSYLSNCKQKLHFYFQWFNLLIHSKIRKALGRVQTYIKVLLSPIYCTPHTSYTQKYLVRVLVGQQVYQRPLFNGDCPT